MKKFILNMTRLAAVAALLCATCNDREADTRSENWDGDVDRLLGMVGGGAPDVTPPDGGSYEFVTIGRLKWMKKNLDVSTAGSWCYDDADSNCVKYGRLYTWSAAKSACQSVGWRLPTRADWDNLAVAVGGKKSYSSDDEYHYWMDAGNALKSTSGWCCSGNVNGTDDFGFSALPGGYRISYGDVTFTNARSFGTWWTATEHGIGAYTRLLVSQRTNMLESYDTDLMEWVCYMSYGFSVRCVQDNKTPATYLVTVSSAGTGSSGGGDYTAEATVAISAGTAPSGQVFKSWTTTSNGVTLVNAYSASTSFIMPWNAVTITAVFEAQGGESDFVTIGGKKWMKKNLNVPMVLSWCYGNADSNCVKYGRLYTWEEAKSACQSVGWRLPTIEEWEELVAAAAGSSVAGKALKSKTGWPSYSGVTNDDIYGFSALPGGRLGGLSSFHDADTTGYWWTATQYENYDSHGMFYMMGYSHDSVGVLHFLDNVGCSVRCVQDDETTVVGPTKYAAIVASAGAGAKGSGTYAAGATVTISAGTPPYDKQFKNWTATDITFANANSATTTFTMPANAVVVTAVFEKYVVDPNTVVKSTFTDSRNNQTYKTVKIDAWTWMAENLNYETPSGNSWCYGNKADSCAKYGRLYDWATAMGLDTKYNEERWGGSDVGHRGVCPADWHLPSRQEWRDLVRVVSSPSGTKLKSESGWKDYNGNTGNGTNEYGFSALPGGYRTRDGNFSGVDIAGYWWTATEHGPGAGTDSWTIDNRTEVQNGGINDQWYGMSVRCVHDD